MSVAATIRPLIHGLLGPDLPIRVTCWDGSSPGPSDAPAELRLVRRRALRRLLWAPNELGLARAYVSGDAEIRGDIMAGLEALEAVSDPDYGPTMHIDAGTKRNVAVAALRLGIIGAPPTPPPEEIALRGRRHSKARDAQAIAHHYDVGNDFYRIVLGESMTYSCAYFEQEPSAQYGLAEAQQAKCDLVARKLGLREGMRVLDVGCGWGTFALRAAAHHGARVVGITLSHEQADHARRRAAEAGLADRVEIRVQDYRDVPTGRSTRSRASGWPSTSAKTCLRSTRRHVRAALAPGAAAQPRDRPPPRAAYRVLPDLVHRQVRVPRRRAGVGRDDGRDARTAGFEVRHVEALREHYAADPAGLGGEPRGRLGRRGPRTPRPAAPGCGGSTWPEQRSASSPAGSA